jgi:hypothetical protein
MKNVKEFVAAELESLLGRGFIATPDNEDQLLAFAKANNGSNDIVLLYMALQYGAKLAYENILENMDEAVIAEK